MLAFRLSFVAGALVLFASQTSCQPHVAVARRGAESPACHAPPEPGSDLPRPPDSVELFPTARAALEALLRREANAEVIAFGEYHQSTEGSDAPSSLSRFTGELLPLFEGGASDLVLETWVASDECSIPELAPERGKSLVDEVRRDTGRPESTEGEIIELINRAQELSVRPHILELDCDDYQTVYGSGEVDYDQMLRVLTRLVRDKAIRLRDIRARWAGRAPSTVVVYGGDLHNDLYPCEEVAPYSFGPYLHRALIGYYLEIDLFVPEYIEDDERLASEGWFPTFDELQSSEHALLIRRDVSSYVLVFPRTSD